MRPPQKQPLSSVHQEPTGQVTLYQRDDRYCRLLTARFGRRFLDYRQAWAESSRRAAPGPFPLSLDLAVNSGCQLQCLMCPLHSRPDGGRVRLMDEKLYRRLMAQAAEHALPALTLGLASEPLLHPHIAAWVEAAVRAGVMDIRLGTNGQALGPELTDALIDSGLTRLEISLDAVSAGVYAKIRGGGFGLERLERRVEYFLEARARRGQTWPLLRLSFLKLDENREELEPFLEKWDGLADMISVQEPIWFPGSRLPRPRGLKSQAALCAQGWQRLAVNHNGDIWPCCSWHGEGLLPHNAAASDIAEVWSSPELTGLRQALSSADTSPSACRNCLA